MKLQEVLSLFGKIRRSGWPLGKCLHPHLGTICLTQEDIKANDWEVEV